MAKWIVHFECPVCGEGSSSPLDKCPCCKSELSSNMVSDEALKHVMWERDIALGQLAEIGKGLGAKMDDVRPVVHVHWESYGIGRGKKFCSNCEYNGDKSMSFFPNCGADMRGNTEQEQKGDDAAYREICGATGLPCCRCNPGACDSRK